MDREDSSISNILEQASFIVRRSKETTGNVGQTESYKGRQIKDLIAYANTNDLWLNINEQTTIYLNKGGENEVFYDLSSKVIKLNNFEYAGDDLENFFIRIKAHNYLFDNVTYKLIGFAYNSMNEFCAVLSQPFIIVQREATEEEIAKHMKSIGFIMDYYDEFHNNTYEVFDAVPNNVLVGVDGDLYFIDTQIRLRNETKL